MNPVFQELIKGVEWCLPFIALCLVVKIIQLSKTKRDRQFMMPLWTLFYVILMMFFAPSILQAIIITIATIANLLLYLPWIGYSIYIWIMSGVVMFINFISTEFGLTYTLNCLVILLYIPFKIICLALSDNDPLALSDNDSVSFYSIYKSIYEWISEPVYFRLGPSAYKHRRWTDISRMFTAFFYSSIVLGVFYLVCEYVDASAPLFAFVAYPVAGILVIESINGWLSGPIREEKGLNDDSRAKETQEPECEKVSEELNTLFGDRILYRDFRSALPDRETPPDWQKMTDSEDPQQQLLSSYFQAIQESEGEITPDYVHVSELLLNSTSVLVSNPFYRDMTAYLSLPLFHELINNKKVLVLCGRPSNQEDILNWMKESMASLTNVPSLWRIDILGESKEKIPDIGVLSTTKLYDLRFIESFKSFFENVSLIILLEPSFMLGTGQVGLRNVLQMCESPYKKLTYCILDRNADGLVDALSHVVRQSITEVIASPLSNASYCRAFWAAEGPGVHNRIFSKMSHYLGLGTELGSIAMKKGARDFRWYSREKMPLADLKWIIEQYSPVIAKYAELNPRQYTIDKMLNFDWSLWQSEVTRKAFLVVEDEFCNAFEMSRLFSTRLKEAGFVNILSENYLLRSYMMDNSELFTNDPKAIPTIVPDYSRSERNFILRMMMRMVVSEVEERELIQEMNLYGLRCLDPYDKLGELIGKYTGVKDFRIQTHRFVVKNGGQKFTHFSYSIPKFDFDQLFNKELQPAFFVVENEKMNVYFMGNKLMGHITQTLLPGQHFVYDGKAYEVRSISSSNGIIVRRSADHIHGRVYYRQLRSYSISNLIPVEAENIIRGLIIQTCFANINVKTDGYLEMNSRNNLKEAFSVELDQKIERKFHHKEIIMIRFPESSPEIRYTICVLLNELFYTLYPGQEGYIQAVMNQVPDELKHYPGYDRCLRSLVSESQVMESDESAIYLLEDSNMDLGLLVSVVRNFKRIMEIATDYLDWYLEKEQASETKSTQEPEAETHSESDEGISIGTLLHGTIHNVDGEDEELLEKVSINSYLSFGYDRAIPFLALTETHRYLVKHGFLESNLSETRKTKSSHQSSSDLQKHQCDFCGAILELGKFDVLKDGRERCETCSKTAVKSRRQFKKVFSQTLAEMENLFQIHFDSTIKVRMVNAKKVNKDNNTFIPTPGFDVRWVGYAQQKSNGIHEIYCENGAPLWNIKSTLVHELSHIWQFENWKMDQLDSLDSSSQAILVEGFAVWTESQYLMGMGQKERALRYIETRLACDDEYGKGLASYIETYPIQPMDLYDPSTTPYKIHPLLKNPSPAPSNEEPLSDDPSSLQNGEVSEKKEEEKEKEKEVEEADSKPADSSSTDDSSTAEADLQDTSNTVEE